MWGAIHICLIVQHVPYSCGAWWLSGKSGALHPEGRRFKTHSSRHVRTLGKSFTHSCLYCFGMLAPTQYQCCSWERLWVVVDFKRCSWNIWNEWTNLVLLRFHNPSKEIVIGRNIVPPVSDDVQLSTEEYRSKLYEVCILCSLIFFIQLQWGANAEECHSLTFFYGGTCSPLCLNTFSFCSNYYDGIIVFKH